MLSELDAKGVRFASTSNTPPNALGKGRFAAEDFAREISAMANRFKMISVEGEDFRHRSSGSDSPVLSAEGLGLWVDNLKSKNSLVAKNGFDELLNHLSELHPTKYGALIKNLYGLALENVYQIQDQVAALRWVACVDRLYEAQVRIANTGIPLTQVFSEEMTGGTYRKKYLRAISRLGSLVDV
jgi:cell division protein ZapE